MPPRSLTAATLATLAEYGGEAMDRIRHVGTPLGFVEHDAIVHELGD